jgi:hypothetical protein
MTANELKDHLREWMRKPTEDLTAHLHEMGIEGTLPKAKQALVKLHADHHGSAPLTGSEAVGATDKPEPAKAPARKAPAKVKVETVPVETNRRKRAAQVKAENKTSTSAPKPAPKAPARKPAKADPKPAPARRTRASAGPAAKAPARKPAPKPAPVPAANGTPANATKHDLAKRLIDMVAAEFASETPENKAKLAYWLHGLPTGYPNGGGGGYLRYWPAGLPRPTTAGWRKPEGE